MSSDRHPFEWIINLVRRKSSTDIENSHQEVPALRNELPDPNLELHRERLSSLLKTLFFKYDAIIAKQIGYSGNILEEIFKRRPIRHGDQVNTDGLDPHLVPFVNNPHSFFYRKTDMRTGGPAFMYEIDGYSGSFTPKISVATENGSLEIGLFTGPSRQAFHSAWITRFFHDESEHFSHARTIRTFVPNSVIDDPDIPLTINDRLSNQKSITIEYDHPDEDGNVSIKDGQTIMVLGSFDAVGTFSAKDNSIAWQHIHTNTDPQVMVEGNQIIISTGPGKNYSFPLKTNIYTEIRDLVSHRNILS